jgi:hypothetical protein
MEEYEGPSFNRKPLVFSPEKLEAKYKYMTSRHRQQNIDIYTRISDSKWFFVKRFETNDLESEQNGI